MKRPSIRRSTHTSLAATGSTLRMASSKGYREKSLVLDAALREYRQRREQGEGITAEEFCGRFPDYQKSLLRLLDVEDTLGDLGEIDDPFPEPGGEFLGFEIVDQIGVGAIARVYLATEPELGGRTVVIKVSADGTAEAATLGRLQHPNIVQVYSVKKDERSGMTAVCMPYQGSATLTDVLDDALRQGGLPQSSAFILDVATRLADMNALRHDDLATQKRDPLLEKADYVDGVVHLGLQLSEALAYAHSVGVLHRDLKPSNVLLTPHGRPMLLDFNLSFDAAHDAMPRGGTLPYMAPEQIRAGLQRQPNGDEARDPRGDVFSLGVILYELLTLRLPYGGPPDHVGPQGASLWQLQAHETPPPPVRELNPAVPPEIGIVIERCLAVDPEQRFRTMDEVADVLEAHFRPRQRVQRWYRRHRLLCQMATVLLAALLTAGVVFAATRPPYAERQFAAGLAAYESHDFEQAIRYANRALTDRPDFVDALLLRAVAHVDSDEREKALPDFESAARLRPSAAVYDHWGCALYKTGDHQGAAKAFAEAIRLQPSDARLVLKLAAVLLRSQRDVGEATDLAKKAIATDPHLAASYYIRFYCAAAENQLEAALSDADRAVRLAPHDVSLRLAITDRLLILQRLNPNRIEAEVRSHLEVAVQSGVARKSLLESQAYRSFRRSPWWNDLTERASNGQKHATMFVSEILTPSLPLFAAGN